MTRFGRECAALAISIGLLLGCSSSDSGSTPPPLAFDPSYLAASSDPCSDFYQYACGTWITQHPVDPGQTQSRFANGDGRESIYFWQLLQDMQGTEPDLATERGYYQACLAAHARSFAADRPLDELLALARSLTRIEDLPRVLAGLHAAGVGALFRSYAAVDPGDPAHYVLTLSRASYSLPRRESYADPDLAQAYRLHMSTLASGAQSGGPSPLVLDTQAVFDFERAVAEAMAEPVVQRDPVASYQPTAFSDLPALLPGFDWAAYLEASQVAPVNHLVVRDALVLPGLAKLLPATPVSVISQYLFWQVLETHAWAVSAPLAAEEFAFHQHRVDGRETPISTEWTCLSATRDAFGFELSRHYVERFVAPELKPTVGELVSRIRSAMNDDFALSPWLDDETRALAQDKLQRLTQNVAYPEPWPARQQLALSGSASFLKQRLIIEQSAAAKDAQRVAAPVEAGFTLSPDTTNATYSPSQNSITLPVAILQDPFFRRDRPPAFNLGALGSVIGHELTHAFDDQGRHFDGTGKLSDWWTEAAAAEFEHRTQCLVDEYSSFEAAPAVHVDGALTLGENVADLGGLKLAFRVLEQSPGPTAQGFTPEQQFFLAYAQLHCESQSPEAAAQQAATDVHSPDAFRVNGVVRNLPEFAAAFACAPGTPLAPVDRCEVW